MPLFNANWYAKNSQAPLSMVSFLEGNFAIHKSPFSSTILAYGLAPPKYYSNSSIKTKYSKFQELNPEYSYLNNDYCKIITFFEFNFTIYLFLIPKYNIFVS